MHGSRAEKNLRALINCLAQRLTWLEMGNPLFRYGNAFTRTRVSTHARWATVDRETSEPTNFDPVAAHKRIADRVKDGLNGELCISMRKLPKSVRQLFY